MSTCPKSLEPYFPFVSRLAIMITYPLPHKLCILGTSEGSCRVLKSQIIVTLGRILQTVALLMIPTC
jgi:hypothetical protein